MIEHVEILLLGCPVCRQRTRHLMFCRYRPPPLEIPPIAWMVLVMAPFWSVVGFVLGNWIGVGIAFMVLGLFELALAAAAPTARRAQDPDVRASEPPEVLPEEIVGALYPGEMRHWHRQKGVCTPKCEPKRRAA